MSKKTNNKRINFATSKILEYPDLLEVQLKSFHDFFQLETTPESIRFSRKFSRSKIPETTIGWSSSTISSILRSIRSRSVLREDSPTAFL